MNLLTFLFIEFHNSLVENGVTDYDWSKFSLDMEKALVENVLVIINLCHQMKPKTFMKMMTTISGEEKADHMAEIFEKTGWMNKAILLLTCLYVKDKETFLVPK